MKKIFTSTVKCRILLIALFSSIALPAFQQSLLNPFSQPQFVNPLPVPAVIDGRNGGTFTIGISQFDQWLGLVNPSTLQPMPTKVWGYEGSYPGPTILAKTGVPLNVFWHNNLLNSSNQPLPHLLPIDPSVHWALDHVPNWMQYGIPVVTHLHGGHSESESDGLPDAWFTPNFSLKGNGFIKGDAIPYHYSNNQEAATIWYHDHALGITRLNVYAGLAGYYLITDPNEMDLQATNKLPAAPYDLGLAIQDRMFTSDGQLFYPSAHDDQEEGQPAHSILPEFFGDFILVNGMAWPVLDVEPRQYRFRVLNGSDSRFYNLFLSGNQTFQQIGTDNGLLPSPVPLTQMLLGPGERRDVVIDFSNPGLGGQTIILRNNAKTPFPKGSAIDPKTTGQIMAFRVSKPLDPNYPITQLPSTLRAPILPLNTTLPARKLILFEAEDEFDRLKPMLGTVEDGVLGWDDPITENPQLNSTEIWEIYNETEDAHPIHLHLVSSQLINRQKFRADINEENGKPTNIRFIGQPQIPAPDERGWKDTWIMYPGEVTRIIAKFDLEGLYAWHCHILSHEDHEMMRSYYVGEMDPPLTKNATLEMDELALEKQVQLAVMPNPFTQHFSIRFNLPQPSSVMVNMYDSKGGLIKKVQNKTLSKGQHTVTIDGTDLVNGIYFCEIVINQQRIMRKIILQK
ncbi:multicopper oxidase domain-containing protein [Flavihumibacter sp.]|uniref:multicopper oxidase domain-containing protein n=1 Tax=Flavihumibacter sp. TaxID=1913981 RepID=UPI002FC93D83